MTTPFDLLTIGRIGADIYPLQDGVGLEDVETFGKYLGGSAANVAVAGARHGLHTAVITGVGDDPFGRYCKREADRLGVDTRFFFTDPSNPTPVTFCEIFPPDNFPLYFYRRPKAPDLNFTADHLDLDAIAKARIYWSTVTGLSEEPSRGAHFTAWRARTSAAQRSSSPAKLGMPYPRDRHTVLDLDYRPMFWLDPAEAREQVALALPHITVAVGNLEECEVAVGESDPHRAADALLERGVEIAVVKQGPDGVLGKTRSESFTVPPFEVEVVNGLGAGDAFGGALVFGLVEGWDLERILRFANLAGAIVASRRECSTAMPRTHEVLDLLEVHRG